MKLGILCTMINGFGRRGFYNTQEIGLGRALVRRGHEVIIYKGYKRTENQKDEAEVEVINDRLRICYLPLRGIGAHGYLNTKILSPNLDGLLCFTDNQIFMPHVMAYCRKHHIPFVPYVGTAHSLHTGVHARVMDTLYHQGTLRQIRQLSVIAKTEGAKEELRQLGVADVTVAPVGLDTEILNGNFRTEDRSSLREKYGFSPEDILITNVARMEPEKRTADLLKLVKKVRQHKDVKLLLIGEGPLAEEIDRKIEEMDLSDVVRRISRIPYEHMWEVYTISDYFVNMNREEIFGMAIMEAVYYEVSVAASMAPGPSITLKDMPGHHLCQNDKEMEDWLSQKYPPQRLLRESACRMRQRFSWDHCARAFEEKVRLSSSLHSQPAV